MDVTDRNAAFDRATRAVERFGRIDVAVNNAGYSVRGAADEVTAVEVRGEFDTNFFGAPRVTQATYRSGGVPVMRRQGPGHIVNVSSAAGGIGVRMAGLYCASKFPLEGLSAVGSEPGSAKRHKCAMRRSGTAKKPSPTFSTFCRPAAVARKPRKATQTGRAGAPRARGQSRSAPAAAARARGLPTGSLPRTGRASKKRRNRRPRPAPLTASTSIDATASILQPAIYPSQTRLSVTIISSSLWLVETGPALCRGSPCRWLVFDLHGDLMTGIINHRDTTSSEPTPMTFLANTHRRSPADPRSPANGESR